MASEGMASDDGNKVNGGAIIYRLPSSWISRKKNKAETYTQRWRKKKKQNISLTFKATDNFQLKLISISC